MILASDAVVDTQSANWQQQLKKMVRTPEELLALTGLDASWLPAAQAAHRLFPVRTTRSFVAKMQPGNPQDPLLLQVLPLAQELLAVDGYVHDPLQEASFNKAPGILHKYHGRALLITTSACAIHCRYCFRRHFAYDEQQQSRAQWRQQLAQLLQTPDMEEIILSGGDPLMLDTDMLRFFSDELRQYPQIKRLRFHTRLPILLPDRIDDAFCNWLRELPWQLVMVIHSNHAQELCAQTARALAALRQCQVTLLNQAVLLAGINDDESQQLALCQELMAQGVLPYYLHLLDPVAGAAHFDVDETTAVALIESLRNQLPGYMVPKLVREEPGKAAKQPR